MIDIIEVTEGRDLGMADTVVPKAANLLQTQLGYLDYAPLFGVDLTFFIDSSFQFQNESFKSYLVEQMMQNQINVADCVEVIESLYQSFTWRVGDATEQAKGFIR